MAIGKTGLGGLVFSGLAATSLVAISTSVEIEAFPSVMPEALRNSGRRRDHEDVGRLKGVAGQPP
jgi:hypothetical protein